MALRMREHEEVLVNEYWRYEGEPMHVIRYQENGKRYLVGKEIAESAGIRQARKLKGYLKPEEEN